MLKQAGSPAVVSRPLVGRIKEIKLGESRKRLSAHKKPEKRRLKRPEIKKLRKLRVHLLVYNKKSLFIKKLSRMYSM